MFGLPVELWILILSFLKAHEEFPAALVCKMFNSILSEKRDKRLDSKWRTCIVPFCRNTQTIDFIHQSSPYNWSDIRDKIPNVLAKQMNYDTLIRFMHFREYYHGLYETLMEQGAFDVVSTLLETNKMEPPLDGITTAIKSGQFNLVKLMYNEYRTIQLDFEDFQNAIRTANIDIVRFVYNMVKGLFPDWPISYLCVKSGNLEIVKFAHTTIKTIFDSLDSELAYTQNFTDILAYLIDIGCPIKVNVLDNLSETNPSLADKIKKEQVVYSSYYDNDYYSSEIEYGYHSGYDYEGDEW